MNFRRYLLLLSGILLLPSGALFAQNQDSIKAYILELIEPAPNFALTYGTSSISLEYIEGAALTPATEDFLIEKKEEYERTRDPMTLYLIAQTYKRMNQLDESEEWGEKAVLEIESQMGKYPDSIEIVENAYLIYLDRGQTELACIAAKMVSDHYKTSKGLLTEALTYMFTGQSDQGLATSNKGLLLYPDEAEWYMTKILFEFTNKISLYPLGSEEFLANENLIDRAFLDEGIADYPDNPKIELVSFLGNFFLFAYEEIVPKFFNQINDDLEIVGFEFELGSDLDEKLDLYFEKAIKLSKKKEFKNWHSLYYTLGMIEMFRANQKEAIGYFEKAIDLMKPKYRQSQDNVYHYYDNLIMCHRVLGDVNSAEKCAKLKATEDINIDPVAAHFVEMALYRAMNKDIESAMSLLNQALEIDSTEISAYSHKAMLLMLTDQMDQARELFLIAETISQEDIVTFKAVTLFHLLQNNTEQAISLVNQLEMYDPTDDFIEDARRLMKTE